MHIGGRHCVILLLVMLRLKLLLIVFHNVAVCRWDELMRQRSC